MRVLIYEPQFAGHNLAHAARLARGVERLGCEVVLATSRQAVGSQEFGTFFGDLSPRLHVMDGFSTSRGGRAVRTSGIGGAAASYRTLIDAIRCVRPDHAYVPYGNCLARTAALPFGLTATLARCGAEAETLILSGRYLQQTQTTWRRIRRRALLNLIAAGPWRRVFHHDEAALEHFHRHGGRMADIGALMPDPCTATPDTPRDEARLALGLPVLGRAIAVVGLIEPRKGVRVLLDALRRCGDRLRRDDRLLLLGRVAPDVKALLRDRHADLVRSGRVVAIDRQLSAAEFGCALRAADVVATVYPTHPYTSSILVAAAAARRPVLASDNGWIGRTVRSFRLGRLCRGHDPAEVAHALTAALNTASEHRLTSAAGRLVRYSSDANYVAHWTGRLRERLGLGPSPDLVPWAWVTGRTREVTVQRLRPKRTPLRAARVAPAPA